MAQWLSKIIFAFLFFVPAIHFAQDKNKSVYNPPDYKDNSQFEHFYKRRTAISKWQINQLKNGALVVRLHNNKKLIESLRKMGKADLATQKEYEMMAINKNIVLAFQKYYTFSKVYFFYSHHSDTLLNGTRSGIFLDSNLVVDPSIEMKEKFYLLAEKDDVYNSSIGYVKEDTALLVKEIGNPSKEAAIVIKNKYGHQLKDPFPFYVTNKSTVTGTPIVKIKVGDAIIPVNVEKRQRIERHYIYVAALNRYLSDFYKDNKDYEVTDENIKPFLY
ncbi:MAG: hypothetical protein JNK50_10950 [Bacteroidia bacterium]|nr:hypothetical protein [Bacteroidia bacterium]